MMNGEALIKLPVEYDDCSESIVAIGCRGYVDVNVVRRWQWQRGRAGRAFLSWLCALRRAQAKRGEKLGKR